MKKQFREKAYEICQRAYEKMLNVTSLQRNIYSNQFFFVFFFAQDCKDGQYPQWQGSGETGLSSLLVLKFLEGNLQYLSKFNTLLSFDLAPIVLQSVLQNYLYGFSKAYLSACFRSTYLEVFGNSKKVESTMFSSIQEWLN